MKSLLKNDKTGGPSVIDLAKKLAEISYYQTEQPDGRFWAESSAKAARIVGWIKHPPQSPVMLRTAAQDADELLGICEAVITRKAWLSDEGRDWWEMQARTVRILKRDWSARGRKAVIAA
ncbi:hypothetical protein AAFN60_01860 [Roseibacillus persicicus]|uniref:hypothetical protein n=1 Tax=Roseibacillus persicicus TaxID=454148 RepID=UPI00398A60B0